MPCADQPAAAGILTQVESRLGYLGEIGLDYLTPRSRRRRACRPASCSGSS